MQELKGIIVVHEGIKSYSVLQMEIIQCIYWCFRMIENIMKQKRRRIFTSYETYKTTIRKLPLIWDREGSCPW